MTGNMFVIEGGEGAGKSTLAGWLAEQIPGSVYVREPGGAVIAESIRNLLLNDPNSADIDAQTQFFLFWAARADYMQRVVIPALKEGKTIISDRGDISTYAYQVHAQGDKALEWLFWKMRSVVFGEYGPSIYIVLDVDPGVGLARVKSRKGEINHFDQRDISFHRKVREGYAAFYSHNRVSDCCYVVDAGQSLEQVQTEVLAIAQEDL